MLDAPLPADEAQRMAALTALNILDSPPEERFDRITRIAQQYFAVPIALVSLIDTNRQWFKSCQGLNAGETPRNISFCGHAILDEETFIVPDALLDPRFADNPLVTAEPHIRFYAGQPLRARNGSRLGTLCIIDTKPRVLTPQQLAALRDLAAMVENEINMLDVHTANIALHDSELRLAQTNRINQAILNGAEHLIIATKTDGTILTFNRAAERALGYSAAELVNQASPALFHDAGEVQRRAAELQALGIAVAPGFEVFVSLARRGEVDANEWSYIRRDGSRFPVLLTVTSLLDERGKISGFLGIATDISAQKKAEQTLQETSQSLARAQQIAHLGNWTWHIVNNTLHWSDEIYRIFGLPQHQYTPSYEAFIQSVHPADRERVQNAVTRALDGEPYSIDHRIVCPDGTEKFVHEQAEIEFSKEGKPLRMEGTVQDVSERIRVERMKTEFISTVSHELRTPLTSIRGALGLIAGGVAGELPPQAKSLVDIAHKNSERLILLVNDILDMEKIESGKMSFNFQDVPLIPILQQALEANLAYAEQCNVSFSLAAATKLPPIHVDVDRFMQVLANLLSNAAKFSPAGGTVNIATQLLQQHIRVSVSDYGSGIPPAFQKKIFQKFSQADSSDTRIKGGTGLGLSISKAIVEGMGGEIGFTSSAGTGTTFFADFPCSTASTKTHDSVSGPQRGDPSHKKKPVILHVEDDQDICKILLTIIGDAATVVAAHTLHDAQKMLLTTPIDLIILDLGLPDGEGSTLLSLSKQQQLNVPVIIFSATELNNSIGGNVKAALVKSRTSNAQLLANIRQII